MKRIILVLFVFISAISFGQAPKRFFTKIGGTGVDIGYSAKPTLDRHYIIAGSTSSYGAGNTDVYLVKLDSMGFPIWQKTFGGFGNDVGRSVVQLPDSGYVVAGYTNSYGAGGYDAYIIKTDKSGNLIWQKTFGGMDWDFANDLVLTPDGDIAIVGNTSSFGHGKKDGLFLKFDFSGNLVQQKFLGGIENEELRSIIVTQDLLLATVGFTESKGDVNGDSYFLKLDLIGDTIFTKSFGGLGKDYFNDITQKSTGEFAICGAGTYTPNPKTESSEFCLSSSGTIVWQNHDYVSSTDEAFVSVANSNQFPQLTAYLRTIPVPLFKLDGNIFITYPGGSYFRSNSFCGSEDEIVYSMESMSDGGYICTGSTLSFGAIGEDVFFIRLDSAMITYDNLVGIKENKNVQQPSIFYDDDINLNVIFPTAQIPQEIGIYDLNGKKIMQFFANEEILQINLSNLSPSIYILKFKYDGGRYYNTKIIRR